MFISGIGRLIDTADDGPDKVFSPFLPNGEVTQCKSSELPVVRKIESTGEVPVKGYERSALDLAQQVSTLYQRRRLAGHLTPDKGLTGYYERGSKKALAYELEFDALEAKITGVKRRIEASLRKRPGLGLERDHSLDGVNQAFDKLFRQLEDVRPP